MRQVPPNADAVSPRLPQAKMAATGRADTTIPPPLRARTGGRDILRRHVAPLETVSVDVPEAGLEIYEAALSSVCATVGLFRNHRTGAWRVEGVTPVGDNQSALVAALALAAELSGVEAPVRRMSDRGGRLAGSILCFVSRATHWPTLLGTRHPSPHPAACRTFYPDPGCRPCLRVRGTWFDARVHSRPGACRLEAPAAHPGSRHGLGHSCHGCRPSVASRRAGNRYRAMVDMCGETECSAKPAGALGQGTACERLATSGSSGRRALRSRARQHPGPAAVPHGAPTRAESGTWSDGHPRGTAAEPGAQRPCGPSALWT